MITPQYKIDGYLGIIMGILAIIAKIPRANIGYLREKPRRSPRCPHGQNTRRGGAVVGIFVVNTL